MLAAIFHNFNILYEPCATIEEINFDCVSDEDEKH